ncbi:MAG: LysR family transcriptional regulator [Gammaproteobacteria bacterium]
MYSTAENLIRRVTLRQLQIFETVVRLGGYTRAAEALHLTQPTVSMQVKKLSEAIGYPLLEKVGHHLHTTAAGREVYTSAQNILGNMMALGESVATLEGSLKGPLRIAVITTAKYFMPHLLGAFITQYPEVKPMLKVTNRSRVLERLKSNEDDLLIMGQVPVGLDVEAHPFVDNELVVVASIHHPLTKCSDISLEQLSKERFLIREAGSGTRLAIDRLFADQGLEIQPYMELGSSEAIKQAVMAGLGISVLSRHNLRLELAGNYIAILDVKGFPLFYRWYAVHLKGKKLSLVSQTFLNFLLQQGKDMLQQIPDDKRRDAKTAREPLIKSG